MLLLNGFLDDLQEKWKLFKKLLFQIEIIFLKVFISINQGDKKLNRSKNSVFLLQKSIEISKPLLKPVFIMV